MGKFESNKKQKERNLKSISSERQLNLKQKYDKENYKQIACIKYDKSNPNWIVARSVKRNKK